MKYPQACIQPRPHSRYTPLGSQTSHSFSHKSMTLGALQKCTEVAELSGDFQQSLTKRGATVYIGFRHPDFHLHTTEILKTPTPSTTATKCRPCSNTYTADRGRCCETVPARCPGSANAVVTSPSKPQGPAAREVPGAGRV